MKLLNTNHIITGNEYFRQIEPCRYDSDNYALNHLFLHWTSIRYLLGECWRGKALKDINYDYNDNYPMMLNFNQQYEFCIFDNKEEKKLARITKDKEIQHCDGIKWSSFRNWSDWISFYCNELTEKEKDNIINAELDLCPDCNKGKIIDGKCNVCNYKMNIYNDNYFEFNERKKELIQLKQYLQEKTHIELKLFVIDFLEDYKKIKVFTFPYLYTDYDSFILNPQVDCMCDRIYFKNIKFDNIIEKCIDGEHYIYLLTKNMNKEYEKEVCNKLLNYSKEKTLDNLIEQKNKVEESIKQLQNNSQEDIKVEYFSNYIPMENFEF